MIDLGNRASFPRTLLLLAALLPVFACGTTTPRRDPLGERLPALAGEALDGTQVRLPDDVAGEPAVLLVGYAMDAQFDIDRWILGLVQLKAPVRVLELATIEGMLPGMAAGFIEEGMRSGIPSEDWASVVTLYRGDAARLAAFTGDAGERSARVLLLDRTGHVAWFADRGYSAGQVTRLTARARDL